MTATSPPAVMDAAGPFRQERRVDEPPPFVDATLHPACTPASAGCFGPAGVRPGERVLVSRDARPATHAELARRGAVPAWLPPRIDTRFNLGTGLHPEDVAAALSTDAGIRVLHVVSPSYAGVRCDLSALRSACAPRDVTLVVDDSLGSGRHRPTGERHDHHPTGTAVRIARHARTLLGRIPGIHVLSAADLALPPGRLDPCRVLLEVRGRGLDGPTAARVLREDHGVEVRGVDATRVGLDIGPDDDVTSVRRLVLAVAALGAWAGPARPRRPDPLSTLPAPGEQVLTPRQAWAATTTTVPLRSAVGRVCTELITPYPPGVPVVTPGEVVTAPVAAWLMESSACGVLLRGVEDPTMTTVRVVADT